MLKNLKIVELFLPIMVILLFSGCMGGKQPILIKYPDWYTKQEQDTNIILYATAEANSEKEAVTLALNDIASKISISVESKYTSITQSSINSYSKNTKQYIKNSVKKIEFTSYKVLHKKKLKNEKYIVCVKVDKRVLAKSLILKIKNNIKQYGNILSDKYSNITSKIKKYQMVSEQIPNTESSIFIVQSLGNTSSAEKYLSKLNNQRDKINLFINGLKFKITSSKVGDDFYKTLSSIITEKGFSIVNNSPDIKLNVNVSKKEIKSLGYKILKVVVNIEAKDGDTNKIIGRDKIIIGGKSISSFKQANNFAIINFKNKIINEQIFKKLLGI